VSRCYEAELHRLTGERLLAQATEQGGTAAAEACFQESLAIARRQGALSLELRTAVSLARVHRRRGRHDLARDLVAPIYGRFSEGLETPDVREARALLETVGE